MRLDTARSRGFSRRSGLVALVALVALSPASPLLAQTLRFSPTSFNVPSDPNTPASVDIFIDSVPNPGLFGFDVVFRVDRGSDIVLNPVLDPTLSTAWNDPVAQTVDNDANTGAIHWEVHNSGGAVLPKGTVKLGTIKIKSNGSVNGVGTMLWDDQNSFFIQAIFVNQGVSNFVNAEYTIGSAQSDLTLTGCVQSSPADPNHFVDGDTVTVSCTARNLGPGSLPRATLAVTVISADATVDSTDTVIDTTQISQLTDPSVDANRSSGIFTISHAPVFTTPGPRKICTKLDVAGPTSLNQQGGVIFETNELNNVVCTNVTIDFPERDLTIGLDSNFDPLIKARGNALDPNALHAGNGLFVDFTVQNIGTAVARNHTNTVVLTSDPNANPNGTTLCSLDEMFTQASVPPGLLGGQTETRTLGLSANTCTLPFSLTPGNYFIGLSTDSGGQVFESDPNGNSLEGNNSAYVPVTVEMALPAQLSATSDTGARLQKLEGPGKSHAVFTLGSVVDVTSLSFTLTWSPTNLMSIGNPNVIAGDPNDVAPSASLFDAAGRTGACDPPIIDNNAGTLTVTCTGSGTGPGAQIAGVQTVLDVNFTTIFPGPGTFAFSSVTLMDSNGVSQPVILDTKGTFLVEGNPDDRYSNLTPPVDAFPGSPFTTTFDLCNVGFGFAPPGTRSSVQLSADPNVTSGDTVVCSFLESANITPASCVNRSLTTCSIATDLRPGLYTLGITDDPADAPGKATTPVTLPTRVFALREGKSGGHSIESTRAPDFSGSVGPVLANDPKFRPTSIGGLRTTVRNFNLVAGVTKPTTGRLINLYRTPKFLDTDLDAQATSRLRLPNGTVGVLGGADIDGDGEDEMILLKKGQGGEFLDFRKMNYAKRRPEAGISIARTAPVNGHIVGATGIQFDGDVEDEVVVVVDDGTTQSLTINDIAIQDPKIASSTLVPVADDLTFGTTAGDRALSLCVTDYGLDGTLLNPNEQIIALTVDGTGVQSLKVFDPPTVLGPGAGAQATLVAADNQFGGTPQKKKVLAIACTR
ncbi:MAG: hypothetical protein HY049_20025 [Acidobacteria bacterium]|nr:hypothetical protein [Acidobacteriota bacterium]